MSPLWVVVSVAALCALVIHEFWASSTEEGLLEDRISNLKLRLWIMTRLYRIICWLGKDED